ncbi:MAG: GIY-YIG nuclease family protein [Parvularculaceae bacterium]|nr:GIY-YIG nuclease family protein [Parvularculaceae bacterium]
MVGIIYVLTNPAMPGIVKLGKTTNLDPSVRMSQLYTTGVPVPFVCELAVSVDDETKAEQALQLAFGPYRINPKREFFQIEPEQAIAILKLIGTRDVTPTVNAESANVIDRQDIEAGERLRRSRRPNFDFQAMNIPVGAEIRCIRTGEVAVVASPRKVLFRNEEMSLTQATRLAHELEPGYAIQPNPNWTYKDRNLSEIYDETYGITE